MGNDRAWNHTLHFWDVPAALVGLAAAGFLASVRRTVLSWELFLALTVGGGLATLGVKQLTSTEPTPSGTVEGASRR